MKLKRNIYDIKRKGIVVKFSKSNYLKGKIKVSFGYFKYLFFKMCKIII